MEEGYYNYKKTLFPCALCIHNRTIVTYKPTQL